MVMAELPRGTVTFLFSDVEGSTRLAGQLGDEWPEVLEQHRRLLRAAFATHDGHEVKTEGDGFFVAFGRARDGVLAAADAQRAIEAHPWPEGARIRVRIGIHTGDGTVVDNDYVGLAVHHAARVSSVAHGGQVVVSDATRHLTGDLPTGVELVPLGAYRLKDIDEPVVIHQVTHPELQRDFPPLRVTAGTPTNLPAQLTSFVGREEELRVVEKLVNTHRLVTLMGAGGAGKTRLAVEAAGAMLQDFDDGVWLVELARVTDPDLCWNAIAESLGLRAGGAGQDLPSIVTTYFRGRRALLVLDNCEHVIAAAAGVSDALLRAAPELRILATSREALGIAGEHAWRVPSLDVPREGYPAVDDAWAATAVRLFVERAEDVGAAIERTPAELEAITHICTRLDGMPLAIELAAARARSLAPTQLAARLDDRFRLLTGGSRTALPRQQTLQALVDWSHELLDDRERAVLRRTSVFVGGFTLEAAEAVCAGGEVEDLDVLDLLDALVAKSLVVPAQDGTARFRLLETIRSYARQKLLEAGEVDAVRDAHLGWAERQADAAAVGLGGEDEAGWLQRVDGELENLRAALEWATDAPGKGGQALRILLGTWRFWWIRGKWVEGRDWCERALAVAPDATSHERARALWLAGILSGFLGEAERTREAHTESLALAEASGDKSGMAAACFGLGYSAAVGSDRAAAIDFLDRGAALAEESGNDLILGWCLLVGGGLRSNSGSINESMQERAAEIGRSSHDRWTVGMAHNNLAAIAAQAGEVDRARQHLEAAAEIWRTLGDVYGGLRTLGNLAMIELSEGHLAEADRAASEAIALCRNAGLDRMAATAETVMVVVALQRGDPEAPTMVDALLDDLIAKGADGMSHLNAVVWNATRRGNALDVRRAVDALAALSAAGSCNPEAMHTLGEALWTLGDPAAREHFEQMLEATGDSGLGGFAHLGLARCALDEGDTATAARQLEACLERTAVGEMADSALCAAAETLLALGQPAAAARLLGVALRHFSAMTPPYDRERAAAVESAVQASLGAAFDAELARLKGASPAEIAAAFVAAAS